MVVQQWTLVDATELRSLRASLRQTLDDDLLTPGRDSDVVIENVGIVATELTSNAVRHAQSPAVVTLSRNRHSVIIDVGDDRPSSAPRVTENTPGGHGGRGIKIVQQLAMRTGWYVAEGTKHVWAQIHVPPSCRRWHAPLISVSGLRRMTRVFRRISE